MRRILLLLALGVFLTGTVGAWGDEVETRPAPKRGISAPATPRLSLGINGRSDGVGLQGRMILLELTVDRTTGQDKDGDLVISNPGKSWAELVRIEIRDAAGRVVPGARVMVAGKTGPTLKLSQDGEAFLALSLESAFAPGEYTVAAILEWSRRISSPPCHLTIKPVGATLEREDEEEVALAEIRLHALFGRPDSALAAADRWLQKEPGSTRLLEAKGDALSLAGRYGEAAAVYDSTLEMVPPQEDSPLREAPVDLIRKRNAAEAMAR